MATLMQMCEAEERMSIEDDALFMRLNRQTGEFNTQVVKKYWDEWFKHDRQYSDRQFETVDDDFVGHCFGGVLPGAYNIEGKQAWRKFVTNMKDTMGDGDSLKFDVRDIGHSEKGDVVYFHLDYDVVWAVGPYKNQHWSTTCNGRATVHDGKITKMLLTMNIPVTKKGIDIDWFYRELGQGKDHAHDECLGKKNMEIVKKSMHSHERTRFHNTNKSCDSVDSVMHPIMRSQSGIQTFLDFCHPDYQGEVFSSIVPGGANILGVENLGDWMTSWDSAFDAETVYVYDFGCSEDGKVVYFTADWVVTWKTGPYKGQKWTTSAISQKHIKDDKIWKDYYCMQLPFDAENISERG